MKEWILGIWLILVGMIVPCIVLVRSVLFNQQCAGYLKQTADANTVELALERINIAIDYLEENKLTEGYTSVLWKTEDENIGYWYRNIKACQGELKACLEASALEKSNVLMKVRESLADDGENGTKLTIPPGISRYPYNAIFGVLRIISALMILAGLILIIVWYDGEYGL